MPDGELHVLHNSPSAPPALGNPLVERLRELVPDVAPKQAWTPVAQFAEQGIDAINYGPGATAYAHRQDEQIPIANLHAVYDTLASVPLVINPVADAEMAAYPFDAARGGAARGSSRPAST